MAMREILPGVYTWPWFSERHGYDFNGWFVKHTGGNICVDPVEPPEDVLTQLVQGGVARIVLTNRNHVRASTKVREKTGARVAIHPADAEYARGQGAVIDDALAHGERVGPLTVIDAHGKSGGEIALHWPERLILIVGDACVGKPPGACALLSPKVVDDMDTLKRSLARIAAEVEFDALLLGDGAPIPSGGRAALQALVASFAKP
jgi:glyoxylase-like metal-dependent hydrolase (beta-lactamase superfamily II)